MVVDLLCDLDLRSTVDHFHFRSVFQLCFSLLVAVSFEVDVYPEEEH